MGRLKQFLSTQDTPSLEPITVSRAEARRVLHHLNSVNSSKGKQPPVSNLPKRNNDMPDHQAPIKDSRGTVKRGGKPK